MTVAFDVTGGSLIVLGAGAVATMLLTPLAQPRAVRFVAAGTLLAAAILTLARFGAADIAASELMLDDGMARFCRLLVCLSGLASLVFLRPPPPAKEAAALTLIATLGAAILCSAQHASTIFLGLEVVTLSLIALFVLPLTRPALEAGYKLLILGGIGASTLLFAFALAYAAAGQLGLDAWSQRGLLVGLGTALLLAGLAFKFSLVPFQMWTPDAFTGAPAAAAAFAGVASKVAVAVVLLRIDAAGPPEPVWSLGLAVTGGASILLGNLQALKQGQLTRMLGYSSIAHSGYLAVIVASGAVSGSEAVLFYLASYAPALIAALCVASALGEGATIKDVRGLIWRRPIAGAALVLAMLSLAGLPPTVGFFGKFYLFVALIEAKAWWLLAIAAVGSALGLYVYFRYLTVAFRQPPSEARPMLTALSDSVVVGICAVLILGFGVYPVPLIDAVRLSLP
jgi:NADH-quinone oxidoreductase subunit N